MRWPHSSWYSLESLKTLKVLVCFVCWWFKCTGLSNPDDSINSFSRPSPALQVFRSSHCPHNKQKNVPSQQERHSLKEKESENRSKSEMSQRVVVCSGYFDPIHVGHVEYLQKSKDAGSRLVVIVNNDHQATMKKGHPFMAAAERVKLVRSMTASMPRLRPLTSTGRCARRSASSSPTCLRMEGTRTTSPSQEAPVCAGLGASFSTGSGRSSKARAGWCKRRRGSRLRSRSTPTSNIYCVCGKRGEKLIVCKIFSVSPQYLWTQSS